MSFEADIYGHKVIMDASDEAGGKGRGPRPKPLSLASLGGCTGMDVVSILDKMKAKPESFTLSVTAELSDDYPKIYKKIHIIYLLKGKNLSLDKVMKAVSLSQEKYCGVSAMLRKAAEISYEIKIEE
ncbi:MAG: OsmC family protein [Bacteroidetes bacterium]|nr:OsmC family protein [Bacteroidota bacterium]